MVSAALNWDFHPRRKNARLRMGIPASLVTIDGREQITLLDLSQTGARLCLSRSARLSNGVLKWLGFEAFGSAVWRDETVVGLQFDEPIALDWLLDTRAKLPSCLDEDADVRSFARAWVNGSVEAKDQVPASKLPARTVPHRAMGASSRLLTLDSGWDRAGTPFVIGGILFGLVAGYISCRF